VLLEALQPVGAQSIDVDSRLPIDCVWPVRADRHWSTPVLNGVQYKLRPVQ
jgi:hypothetical protein